MARKRSSQPRKQPLKLKTSSLHTPPGVSSGNMCRTSKHYISKDSIKKNHQVPSATTIKKPITYHLQLQTLTPPRKSDVKYQLKPQQLLPPRNLLVLIKLQLNQIPRGIHVIQQKELQLKQLIQLKKKIIKTILINN